MTATATTQATLSSSFAPIQQELAETIRIFDAELASSVPCVNELCQRVAMYRGKLLRPALLLLSAKASGRLSSAHPTLAAVVEMVHVATLVHDDVLDESPLRRSQPTINADRGNTAAVLLGDYLISHAFHLCSSVDSALACRLVGAATNTVCEGELLQVQHQGNTHLSEAEYLEIIRRKTGALTEVCCDLGARYAGAEDRVIAAMRRYGLSVGVAFQVVDDVLDVIGDGRDMGKLAGNDVDHGKATLPTIHCLSQANESVRKQLRAVLSGSTPRRDGEIRRWAEETGSIPYALQFAERYVQQAIAELSVLPPSESKQSLETMAEMIIRRDR